MSAFVALSGVAFTVFMFDLIYFRSMPIWAFSIGDRNQILIACFELESEAKTICCVCVEKLFQHDWIADVLMCVHFSFTILDDFHFDLNDDSVPGITTFPFTQHKPPRH